MELVQWEDRCSEEEKAASRFPIRTSVGIYEALSV
jgi:hypothetical protein